KDNIVTVFNYKTLDSITSIKLNGEKADAIMYDEFTKKIWVFCGKTNNAMVIDPTTNTVVETVAVGEVPEFAVSNNKGMIYDNAEDGNSIVAIDTKQNKIVKTFSLDGKAAPTGLAIDLKNNLLFSACAETKVMSVLDAIDGKIIASLPISNKVDAVAFDAETKLIFCSGGDGITTIIEQINKDKYELVESLKTQEGAKTMALDNHTHKIYFSTATYKEGTKELVPNSFTVLVYSK
ncbi:MAG: YncE family protein, partial [Ferruginibacter sp.]